MSLGKEPLQLLFVVYVEGNLAASNEFLEIWYAPLGILLTRSLDKEVKYLYYEKFLKVQTADLLQHCNTHTYFIEM